MIVKDDIAVEFRYANWLSQIIGLVAPAHLQVVSGRGTSKTTQIIAERMQEVCYDMPGSLQILVCNTYTNARTNIVPAMITGWQNYKGWQEGKDFVIGVRPPSHFKRCYTPLMSYKNVVSVFNGCCIVIGSLEMISGLAGGSYQHIYADEVKYDDKKKMDTIFPALRGNNNYPHSPYYLGTTFTTDLPDLSKGQFDWILDYQGRMDLDRVKASFYCGWEINKINLEIKKAVERGNAAELKKLVANKGRWMIKHYRCRNELSMFMQASSFSNVDVLTTTVLKNMFNHLGLEEFKQSVLTIKGSLEAGEMFYTGLGDLHYYRAENAEYSESLGLTGTPDCRVLKYLASNKELDGGLDFGKMISLVLGQQMGDEIHCLKSLFTLVPESSRELADQFIRFFKPHNRKVLNLYYDRAGNQYQSSNRDWAGEIKDCIEIDEKGKRTGWRVNLMSRGQSTIFHHQEYTLMRRILEEKTKGLPKLRIDMDQCREMKSSLEVAKIKIKTDYKTGTKTIHKDKSSESLTLHQLPMNSTNFSDAFKYFICRKVWMDLVKNRDSDMNPFLDGL